MKNSIKTAVLEGDTKSYKGSERRKRKRVLCWFPMKYKRKEDREFKKAETKNITTVGICFESEDIFYPNKYIEIELEILTNISL